MNKNNSRLSPEAIEQIKKAAEDISYKVFDHVPINLPKVFTAHLHCTLNEDHSIKEIIGCSIDPNQIEDEEIREWLEKSIKNLNQPNNIIEDKDLILGTKQTLDNLDDDQYKEFQQTLPYNL